MTVLCNERLRLLTLTRNVQFRCQFFPMTAACWALGYAQMLPNFWVKQKEGIRAPTPTQVFSPQPVVTRMLPGCHEKQSRFGESVC